MASLELEHAGHAPGRSIVKPGHLPGLSLSVDAALTFDL